MNLDRLSKVVFLLSLLLGGSCLASIWLAGHYYQISESIAEEIHSVSLLTSRMYSSNRRMTYFARLYVYDGDNTSLDLYNQLKQKDDFSKIVQQLQQLQRLQLTAAENDQLAAMAELNRQQLAAEETAFREKRETGNSQILMGKGYVGSELKLLDIFEALRDGLQARESRLLQAANLRAAKVQQVAASILALAVIYSLLVFSLFIRRGLIKPLQALTEQTRQLAPDNAPAEFAHCSHRGEIGELARALEGYHKASLADRQQQVIKNRVAELSKALQHSTSPEEFDAKLKEYLGGWLHGAQIALIPGEASLPASPQLLHRQVALRLEGRQVATLAADFNIPPHASEVMLLDALADRLGTLWGLMQQRLCNQRLLLQACQNEEELQLHQAAIAATEGWYQGIVEAAPDGLLVIDRMGRVILANPESERILDAPRRGLLSKHYTKLLPHLRNRLFDALKDAFDSKTTAARVEGITYRPNGDEVPIELRLSRLPARSADESSICVVIRDLTLFKQQERELRLAHEQQQAIFTAAPYGIALVRNNRITQVNPSLHSLFGYADGELQGQGPAIWGGAVPLERPARRGASAPAARRNPARRSGSSAQGWQLVLGQHLDSRSASSPSGARLHLDLQGRFRAPRRRSPVAARPGHGRAGSEHEVGVSGQHEPRNPHAHERNH